MVHRIETWLNREWIEIEIHICIFKFQGTVYITEFSHEKRVIRLKCFLYVAYKKTVLKADMKSFIPLKTAAIFFLANLFPKQGISSEYVTAGFICIG